MKATRRPRGLNMTSPPTTRPTQAARLEQMIREHKEEVARLREEFGDPAEALDKFILERFSIEAFLPDDWSPGDEFRPIWEWREEDDDSGAW
jgi:hypothetical protein